MIYATGDTHGSFQRFQAEIFPEQTGMTRDDYVIICGDFGGVWDGSKKEKRNLDWLESLPFTTLFVSGNHENFDRLARYPVEEWCGGKIQRIRPHVIHLTRGQVFELQGHTFFTMGCAVSHPAMAMAVCCCRSMRMGRVLMPRSINQLSKGESTPPEAMAIRHSRSRRSASFRHRKPTGSDPCRAEKHACPALSRM